jgi:type I restriction enzyme M protein
MWSTSFISDPYYLVPRYYDQRLADEVAMDAKRLDSSVTTLGDLVDSGFLSIRKGHEVGSEAYGTGDVPFVRTSDIHNFEVSHDPTNCVSDDIYQRFSIQQKLKAGDILMVVDGRYKIGRCAILHEWNTRVIAQSHLRIISLKQKARFDPIALLYGLSLPSVQREIRRLVFIQSTLGGLGSRISEIRLPDPMNSHKWGDVLNRFSNAIRERSEQGRFLQAFGAEVEL